MAGLTKEMIEAGVKARDSAVKFGGCSDDEEARAIYLAMREKDPEIRMMRQQISNLTGELNHVLAALPDVSFIYPPDDGDVPLPTQVARMVDALKAAERAVAEAVEIMKPFAIKDDAIDRWFGVEYTHDNSSLFSINGERIEVRHIRNARAFVEKHSKGGDAK